MAHSFFKFDFGRDGMPSNMGQANWQRLAKYVKNANYDQPEFAELHDFITDINGKFDSMSRDELLSAQERLEELRAVANGVFTSEEDDSGQLSPDAQQIRNEGLMPSFTDLHNDAQALSTKIRQALSAKQANLKHLAKYIKKANDKPEGPHISKNRAYYIYNTILKHCMLDVKYHIDNFNDLMSMENNPPYEGYYKSLQPTLDYAKETLDSVSSSLEYSDDENLHSAYNQLSDMYNRLKSMYESGQKKARVAHRVWDIVSNDGIPTAHRKVDEMTVINRDHKRLADTSELDVGDKVIMFTDGVQVHARIASVQNDGNLVLNVDGSLVSNIDPGFVFLDE